VSQFIPDPFTGQGFQFLRRQGRGRRGSVKSDLIDPSYPRHSILKKPSEMLVFIKTLRLECDI
jgi:hypothetical protein